MRRSETAVPDRRIAAVVGARVPALHHSERGDKILLLGGLDCAFAVSRPDPSDRVLGRGPVENRQTTEGSAGAAMCSPAADLDAVPALRTRQHFCESFLQHNAVGGKAEVGPGQVLVVPGRRPLLVQIQPEIRCRLSAVRVILLERDRPYLDAARQFHRCAMPVAFVARVLVVSLGARRPPTLRPPDAARSACQHHPNREPSCRIFGHRAILPAPGSRLGRAPGALKCRSWSSTCYLR
jgi:hypothetical protein